MSEALTDKERAEALESARAAKVLSSGEESAALSDAERESALAVALQVKIWTAARRAQLRTSADGSIVVELEHAITLSDGESKRKTVTVRPITLGDVRVVGASGEPKHLQTLAFGDLVVLPKGAQDRLLSQADASAVTLAVDDQLGKYLGDGPS